MPICEEKYALAYGTGQNLIILITYLHKS